MRKEIEEQIIDSLNKAVQELGITDPPSFALEHPDVLSHGDYATNLALLLSKPLKQSPTAIASQIVEKLNKNKLHNIEKIEVAGPGFINFYLADGYFTDQISKILKQKENYGRVVSPFWKNLFGGSKVLVEYSSPNIAKPFTVGHLRSTIIGDAVANILAFNGHKIIRDNHLGDWGTQFGKLIVALKKWSDLKIIEASTTPIKDLVDLYVRFHAEAEKDKTLEDQGRAWFTKLEQGDAEARNIWRVCVELSLKEFQRIYALLDIKFDTEYGESFYEDKMPAVIADVKKAGIGRESEGAFLVFFDQAGTEKEKYPPLMLLKSDGSSLYALRDLAADKWRKKKYGADTIIINEVGIEQDLQFKQLFETEKLLGYVKEGERVHVAHGLYRFKDGKMSTRKGNVIWLDEVISEAIERAGEINKETAEMVAIGALKFNDLKREARGEINFDWEEILNLKGDSGPYLQYAGVRAQSILDKAVQANITPKISFSTDCPVTDLPKMLERFPQIVARAGREYAPHYLAIYLTQITALFSSFYAQEMVVDKTDKNSAHKVALVKAFHIVLTNGLTLLGIKIPERM